MISAQSDSNTRWILDWAADLTQIQDWVAGSRAAGAVEQVAAHSATSAPALEQPIVDTAHGLEEEQQMIDTHGQDDDCRELQLLPETLSNTGPGIMCGDKLVGAKVEERQRIAQGYQSDGSLGGEYSETSPPPGMRFVGYNKGCTFSVR